jgi:MoaA/NifB/PqqE/SkfB family radical SAM enzyme
MKSFFIEKSPLLVGIELNRKCNLRCPMCIQSTGQQASPAEEPEGDYVPLETIKKIAKECRETETIWLSAGGEPLLVPILPEIVKAIKAILPNVQVGFNTNASLLNEKRAVALVEAGLDEFRVSFDGFLPMGHTGGGASPMKIFANLTTLNAIKHELGSDRPVINFVFVIARDNMDQLLDTIRMAKTLGAETFRVTPLRPLNWTQNEQNIYRYKEKASKILHRAEDLAKKLGLELIFAFMDADLDQSLKSCDYPFRFLAIGLEGNVTMCCYGYPLNRNIHQESLMSIWNCEEILELRERLSRDDFPEFCTLCPIVWPKNEFLEAPMPPEAAAPAPPESTGQQVYQKPSWATLAKHTAKTVLDKLNLLDLIMRSKEKK